MATRCEQRQTSTPASSVLRRSSLQLSHASLRLSTFNNAISFNPAPFRCQSQLHMSPLCASFTGVCLFVQVSFLTLVGFYEFILFMSICGNETQEPGQLSRDTRGGFLNRGKREIWSDHSGPLSESTPLTDEGSTASLCLTDRLTQEWQVKAENSPTLMAFLVAPRSG